MKKSINLKDYLEKGGELKDGQFLESHIGDATFIEKIDNNFIMVKFSDGEISKVSTWAFYITLNQ